MGGMRGIATAMSLAALACAVQALPGQAQSASPSPPPSAIGQQVVDGIAVSPAYARSGVVVAMSHELRCSQDCVHLWISRDRGATWSRARAAGWQHAMPDIALDARGRDLLFGAGSSAAQRSDDLGDSWHDLPAAGTPSVSPAFARDRTVAVAGGSADHLVVDATARSVSGSAGRDSDVHFAMAPAYPSGGRFAPVLLGAADSHGAPLVLGCDAGFACGGAPTMLASGGSFDGAPQLALSTDYGNDGVAFARVESGISKSSDGGRTFTPLVLPVAAAQATGVMAMALAPGYREAGPVRTLDVAVQQIVGTGQGSHTGGGVFSSTDGGKTFQRLAPGGPLDGGATAVAVAPDGRVFAGYFRLAGGGASDGLVCSDGGGAWQAACGAAGAAGRGSGSSGGATPCAVASCSAAGAPSPGDAAGAGANSGASAAGGVAIAGGLPAARQVSAPGGHGGPPAWAYIALAVAVALLAAGLVARRRQVG